MAEKRAQPDPHRRRPADRPHQAEHRLSPNLEQLIAEAHRHGHAASSARCRIARARGTRCASGRTRAWTTASTARCWRSSTSTRRSGQEERALRSASELARCVIDLALHPIALADSELRLVYGNAAFAAVTVRPTGDLRNQRLEDVLPPGWDVAAIRGLLLSDTGDVARQVVHPPHGTPGSSWAVDARVMASQDLPGQQQVLIVATPHQE